MCLSSRNYAKQLADFAPSSLLLVPKGDFSGFKLKASMPLLEMHVCVCENNG